MICPTFTNCNAWGSVLGGGRCFSPFVTKRGTGSEVSSSLTAALGTAADGCGDECSSACASNYGQSARCNRPLVHNFYAAPCGTVQPPTLSTLAIQTITVLLWHMCLT